jgi:hypothetical protein
MGKSHPCAPAGCLPSPFTISGGSFQELQSDLAASLTPSAQSGKQLYFQSTLSRLSSAPPQQAPGLDLSSSHRDRHSSHGLPESTFAAHLPSGPDLYMAVGANT